MAGVNGEELGSARLAGGVDNFDTVGCVEFEVLDYRKGTLGVGSWSSRSWSDRQRQTQHISDETQIRKMTILSGASLTCSNNM